MIMMEKTFTNDELKIEQTSFIDNKQNIWFKGKEIAQIWGYEGTKMAVRYHIDPGDKFQRLPPL